MKLPIPPPDTPDLDQLRNLFQGMPGDRAPTWGKMNAGQMLEHCHRFNELCLGRVKVSLPIRWIARLIGPMFLRKLLPKSPKDGPKNLRTLEPIRVDSMDAVDVESARARLLASIDALLALPATGHRHPLYGPMDAAQVHGLAAHHMGHHAHQFGLW